MQRFQLIALAPALFLAACGSSAPKNTDADTSSAAGTRDQVPNRNLPTEKPEVRDANAPEGRLYSYKDGERTVEVHLAEDMLIEFGPTNAGANLVLASVANATELDRGTDGVRMWAFADADPLRVTEDLGRVETEGRFSPVFYPSSSREIVWALPGGIVIGVPADWTPGDVERFALEHGLQVDRRVSDISSTYLLHSPAGIESLEVANRIANGPDVLWATPNWWQSATTR